MELAVGRACEPREGPGPLWRRAREEGLCGVELLAYAETVAIGALYG